MESKLKIFISYSSKDKPIVEAVVKQLKQDGFALWMDEQNIAPTANIPLKISEGLSWSTLTLLFWSQSAAQSQFVQLEWSATLILRKQLLILRLDETALPVILAPFKYIQTAGNWQASYPQLREALEKISPQHQKKVVVPERYRLIKEGLLHTEKAVIEVKSFYLSETLVTCRDYADFLAAHPEITPPDNWRNNKMPNGYENHPAIGVNWHQANAYGASLSQNSWLRFRLPSEAEWEYACRAGATSRWFCGDREDELREYAWYRRNSNNILQPVAKRRPNPWGLYDMSGLVWEWCSSSPEDPAADQRSHENGWRIVKGGSFQDDADKLASAARAPVLAMSAMPFIGFRLVADLENPIAIH
jgi:hypothetical protein